MYEQCSLHIETIRLICNWFLFDGNIDFSRVNMTQSTTLGYNTELINTKIYYSIL